MPNTGFLALAEQRYSVRKFAQKLVEQVCIVTLIWIIAKATASVKQKPPPPRIECRGR